MRTVNVLSEGGGWGCGNVLLMSFFRNFISIHIRIRTTATSLLSFSIDDNMRYAGEEEDGNIIIGRSFTVSLRMLSCFQPLTPLCRRVILPINTYLFEWVADRVYLFIIKNCVPVGGWFIGKITRRESLRGKELGSMNVMKRIFIRFFWEKDRRVEVLFKFFWHRIKRNSQFDL